MTVPLDPTKSSLYAAAGKETGIRQLVDEFYDNMMHDARFASLVAMHNHNLLSIRERMTRFLCRWLGGVQYDQDESRSLPDMHRHLTIGLQERDLWLLCMAETIGRQPWPASLKNQLFQRLAIPADIIRQRCEP